MSQTTKEMFCKHLCTLIRHTPPTPPTPADGEKSLIFSPSALTQDSTQNRSHLAHMTKLSSPKKRTLIPALVALVAGIAMLGYPFVSDIWNEQWQTSAISTYSEDVENLSEEDYSEILSAARDFNQSLREREDQFRLTPEQEALYPDMLKVGDNQAIGYVEIPLLRLQVGICHGADEDALQSMVGHVEWTSLPIGGESTHSVFAGHRGLLSAKLFSDLDRLSVGDIFMVHVLDQTLTYEVDQIKIVEPEDATDLVIEEGKDLCTLLTCTPYGVNTHRLLVRGHRTENRDNKGGRVVSEALQVEPIVVAAVLGTPLFFVLISFIKTKEEKALDL